MDLSDAYYSCPVHVSFQKYLKFQFDGMCYKYTVFPNGLACCPRMFTKLLKPVFASLRKKCHKSVVFIDETLLFGQNYDQCKENVIATVTALERLGFVIHPAKSVLQPVQKNCFLGFVLDSKNMTVTLPEDKITKVALACQNLLDIHLPQYKLFMKLLFYL